MAEELRLSDRGQIATTLDGDATGIAYFAVAGDRTVVTVDPASGIITPIARGVALVEAVKGDLVLDAKAVVVKTDAQYAFDNARRSGATRVRTVSTPISSSVTPPTVTPPVLAQTPGDLVVDWAPPVDPSAVITQLLLDVRSLDGQVVLAANQLVVNSGKPYHFPVADTRSYRVTLTAVNAANLTASAFSDIHAGENAIGGVTAAMTTAPLVQVGFTSEQAGARAYVISFVDANNNVAFSTTVIDSGTTHAIVVDTTGMPSGSYTVTVSDTAFNTPTGTTTPTTVIENNTMSAADAHDIGGGNVAITWHNTDSATRPFTLEVRDPGGGLALTIGHTGAGLVITTNIDFDAFGIVPGGYLVTVRDDLNGSSVVTPEFPFGGASAGGASDALLAPGTVAATPMATTAAAGTTAAMAFDGNNTTAWASVGTGAGVAGEAIGLDFGANPVELGRVVFVQDYADGAYAAAGKVQWADTPGSWTDATAELAFNGSIGDFTDIVPAGTHRYWQVLFTQGNPNGLPVRVTELNMYPYAVPSAGFGETPWGTGPYGY